MNDETDLWTAAKNQAMIYFKLFERCSFSLLVFYIFACWKFLPLEPLWLRGTDF